MNSKFFKWKRGIALFFLLSFVFLLNACKNNTLELNNQNISHEEKFGGIYIEITIDDFNKLGFSFGDSVDITFSNGYELKDLPYYNGYYTDTGMPLLVGYSGYPYIRVGINNGDDLYNIAKLNSTDKASIHLNSSGKYLAIQEALDIHYTDIQGDMSDEKFANFRVVNVGNLKENILYRSASPVDNQHKRAPIVDRLIKDKVNTIINLSDNDQELIEHIEASDFNSPYFLSIYENNSVIALSMNMNFKLGALDKTPGVFTSFKENTFHQKLISGLEFMLDHEGPYLIHCVEGKDRTGFVVMMISALLGATYQEIITDYMITYDNYYDINLNSAKEKYEIIKKKNIEEMLRTIVNDETKELDGLDYAYYAKKFLMAKGMSEDNIDALIQKLHK
jgi:protein tyrosine/serine phosphatase